MSGPSKQELERRIACALIESAGMTAENMQREKLGNSMAYDYADFVGLLEVHQISLGPDTDPDNQPTPKPPKQPTPCVCGALTSRAYVQNHVTGVRRSYRFCTSCQARGPVRETEIEADAAWEELRGALPDCVVGLIREGRDNRHQLKRYGFHRLLEAISLCNHTELPEPKNVN